MREFDVDFFDMKCKRFIEGYRFVPKGETWTREDGEVFVGEMVSPWQDYSMLEEWQTVYDEGLQTAQSELADKQAALDAIYAGVTE